MRKILVLLVLILTGTAAYLWFEPTDSNDALQTDQELMPDYIAQNITRRLFDSDGYLVDSVSAQRLEHFELLGFTQFEKPVYTLYNEDHQPSGHLQHHLSPSGGFQQWDESQFHYLLP